MSLFPTWEDGPVSIITGNSLDVLREIPDDSVNCCVTSPPYWGLRDYDTASWSGGDENCEHRVGGQVQDNKAPGAIKTWQRPGVDASRCKLCGAVRADQQIGLEKDPDSYVTKMLEVFREVRRILACDGTLWLNLGDSYSAHAGQRKTTDRAGIKQQSNVASVYAPSREVPSLGAKQLCGIPWRVAFALQTDGWYLRQDIIWSKINPMPESVKDRCTKAHEYVFLLSKSERYHFDSDAIAEEAQNAGKRVSIGEKSFSKGQANGRGVAPSGNGLADSYLVAERRNKRSVWELVAEPFPGAHFAVFPTELVKPCVLAGCPRGGLVLDPFCGSGTTLLVAEKLGCRGLGIELNPEYVEIAKRRLVNRTFCFPDEEVPA